MRVTAALPPFSLAWDARAPTASLAIPVRFSPGASPGAFGLPPPAASPFVSGSFTASVDAGGSCNCDVISSLAAHANGTHTECVGHVLAGSVTLEDVAIASTSGLMPAVVLTVTPVALGESGDVYAPGLDSDSVVSFGCLQAALSALSAPDEAGADEDDESGSSGAIRLQAVALRALRGGALIIRTLPNGREKIHCEWAHSNPPYLTPAAVAWALAQGVEHLLVDLPSLDREDDGGQLLSHRTFWGLPRRAGAAAGDDTTPPSPPPPPPRSLCTRTITELCFIDSALVADGIYMLNLAVAPLALDAAPSRPVLHAVDITRI